MICRTNYVDHDRLAELAARIEREDPDWREGRPVFMASAPAKRPPIEDTSGLGRPKRKVWFIPNDGRMPHQVFDGAKQAAEKKCVSLVHVRDVLRGVYPFSHKCNGRFIYEPRTEGGKRIALQEQRISA